jgi:alpha-glucan phosphorylases
LKQAKDSGRPMVGVGIRWRQGYVNQVIDANGQPADCFHEQSTDCLQDTGITVSVRARKRDIELKVWKCEAFGNVPLYLLDAFLPENSDALITGQLYGWFQEERLVQEIILGVGGVRALEKLGIEVDYYHFNDSHPLIAGLEMVRREMASGLSFIDSVEKIREKIVFTTHTPVIAGNESYQHDVLEYVGVYGYDDEPDYPWPVLNYDQLATIAGDPFSMTAAGLRLSCRANAVAQLHGETAREMWKGIEKSAPILAITNGVHAGTWQDPLIAQNVDDDKGLWRQHQENKRRMVAEIANRTSVPLREDVLTLGFARRAATYKRSDLIFRAPETVEPWLREGKLQLIFSGKAHPNDMQGKAIIANLVEKAKEYPNSVVFLQDYDMNIGRMLTRGCDVWLNNPVRPMEACGTSGMKAAMNGVLNCSTLDGWWPEGFVSGKTGWQIGDGYEGADVDANDLASLIATLRDDILPRYADRAAWLAMMRNSILMASEQFSAQRMLDEYYERLYL